MLSENLMERRLQYAGIFLILGLLIEALCLLWARPIAFVIFTSVGGLFMFVGISIFLYSLVSTTPSRQNEDG
jgi:hypothetical protein